MSENSKNLHTIKYGDFQTPIELARNVAELVFASFPHVKTIVEPTCGLGNFIKAAIETNTKLKAALGWEINPKYIQYAQEHISDEYYQTKISIEENNFFSIDWSKISQNLIKPILFIGNPPWVTNSQLARLNSKNLPCKTNFQKHSGLEAITGKSNFDISEWMLIKIAEFITSTNAAMAFLIKTSVARRIFHYICKNKLSIKNIRLYRIDSKKYFSVNVDACLFYAEGEYQKPESCQCFLYESLFEKSPTKIMGYKNGKLIANIETYKTFEDIDSESEIPWRSGIKHDCSKIMEFKLENNHLINGLGEQINIPFVYLYPMYKSSHIAKDDLANPEKYMLVTQKKIGENTSSIKIISPKTWSYLETYSEKLDSRKSSIYKKSPRFSVFGVGDYTFQPWKVTISGLYKNVKFNLIGPYQGKPVVLDDTCYMLGFESEEKAGFVYKLLTSNIAKQFIDSIVFMDNKRPITAALLNRINLKKLAEHIGVSHEYDIFFPYSS